MSHDPLPPNQQLVARDKWPVIGEQHPRNDASPWVVSVGGLVREPRRWDVAQLQSLPQVDRTIDLHCVTRWSKLQVRFSGALLSEVLKLSGVQPTAKYINFIARSERNHSTSLALEDALKLETLIAWQADGKPLDSQHGGPVRVIVPGRYFYKSLKWLEKIELLEQDQLGFWEATAGYHNHADPWREERYMAGNLSKSEIAKLLASRDWSDRDLRSIVATGHDLQGLIAIKSLLRDADFRNCNLQAADFSGANLSNAHLQLANLQNAKFHGTDCEGADFIGANLCGADFRGASLFGATLCDLANPGSTQLDQKSHFDEAVYEQLVPEQSNLLKKKIKQFNTESRKHEI